MARGLRAKLRGFTGKSVWNSMMTPRHPAFGGYFWDILGADRGKTGNAPLQAAGLSPA